MTWTSLVGHVISIRLPHFDGMALGFKGSYAGAPVSFLLRTFGFLQMPAPLPAPLLTAEQ